MSATSRPGMGQGIATVSPAWWRVPVVWLALGLPASVVVAGVFVIGMAWRNVDPVVVDTRPHPSTLAAAVAEARDRPADSALEPAVLARNHAAAPRR